MSYIPLHDSLVVKLIKPEEKTASGLIIPGNAKEKPSIGEVIAIGSGKVLENGTVQKPSVSVGDKIIFKTYSFSEIPGEEEIGVVSEGDVLVIVK